MPDMTDSSQMESWEIEVPAVVENIPVVTDFLIAHLEENEAAMKAIHQISVAVDELFSNISYYAYPDVENGTALVRLTIDKQARVATLAFEDEGVAYNPLEKEDPDLDLPLAERAIGGLGIFLVKKTMDKMDYQRQGSKNILTITKKI